MISIEDSIPEKNESYRFAEDIFFIQFNDVSFYIEDSDQENFYHRILCNLFPDIRIEKIFPLNGKDNVIDECEKNIGDKTKVYLVDKDFDDLFGRKTNLSNLFYLNRYSIENYLFELDAIVEYIISEKPRLKRSVILRTLNIDNLISSIGSALEDLIYIFLLVQSRCPRLSNISVSFERFFDFSDGCFILKQNSLDEYLEDVALELNKVDKRLKVRPQLTQIKAKFNLDAESSCLIHFPGKFILKMLKQIIEFMYGIGSRTIDSFSYRIACYSKFDSLLFLKTDITSFLNSAN
ncbi:DUF4435 domain-containing protein [Sphingobacterium deserti]|uniref:DUF4435 domain-containing protein n=1 Tax=Sphingobacterium deserti TaxID=1229276 RepID=A0A0B8T3F6_9SPHI|nr:DUF4435 domain-containing protein [Sphingobacterium deserti]KGE16077.1 hypothetical protein DI53_0192 [Sphingobacterium deserti]